MNFVYKINNKIDGKVYIGTTSKTIEERFKAHLACAKSINKTAGSSCPKLYNAIRAHAPDNFSIELLESFETEEEALEGEAKYIALYDSVKNGLNIRAGGRLMTGENHPFYGRTHSEETKEKIRIKNREGSAGDKNRMFGKTHTDDAKKKMSDRFLGIPIKDETKQKISLKTKGMLNASAKLTDDQVISIRKEYADMCGEINIRGKIKEVRQILAKKYNVCCGSIKNITLNKNWKHLLDA